MMAWRCRGQEEGARWQSDHDDDGEAGAGRRLALLLEQTGARSAAPGGGVAVVVSRWFGGVLLGPARFAVIAASAREALAAAGFLP